MAYSEKEIGELFEKGILVSKDFFDEKMDPSLLNKIEAEEDILVLSSDYAAILSQQSSLVDWYEVDSNRVESEKGRDEELYQNQLQNFKHASLLLNMPPFQQYQDLASLETTLDNLPPDPVNDPSNGRPNLSPHPLISSTTSSAIRLPLTPENHALDLAFPLDPEILKNYPVSIVYSYENIPRKYDVKDFTILFLSRYRFMENLLRNRRELENILTINRVAAKKEKESVSIIGMIEDIRTTKNGHIVLTVEDPTGKIKVLLSKNKKELLQLAKELTFDEVIGITGKSGDKIIFAENIIWPDVPTEKEIKKSPVEEYAIFLSDLHVGSSLFLKEEFQRFISWLCGEAGNDSQKAIAEKVKYIFIAGDLVDGVGVYPGQEEELEFRSIREQYHEVYRLLKQIPSSKRLIFCPGNHDVVHLAEPQPIFYKEYAAELYQLPHATIVSNPALVNIGKTENFSGFDVLLYHGYSFDYYINGIEALRNNGGYHRADLVMKYLLKRRHLAPSFKSTPYHPSIQEDPLLITKVPDFFITGHIHYSKVANYKGITMISGSCWQAKTSFQEKLGHEPEPARVPLVNLKTREVKILKFI